MSKKRGNGTRPGTLTTGPRRFDDGRFLSNIRRLDALSELVRSLEDRRTWHPSGPLRPAGALSRSARTLVVERSGPARWQDPLPGRVQFSVPEKVSGCVRRKERREVLFAKGHGGKGSRRAKRRNNWSDVKC